MIEIRLIKGSFVMDGATCEKGDLIPTIAALLQKYESEHGDLTGGQKYAIEFWPVR